LARSRPTRHAFVVKSTVDVLNKIEVVVYVVLAVVAVARWQTRRGQARAWMAATFAVLATVIVVAQLLPSTGHSAGLETSRKILIAALVLFPYLLYRFTATFHQIPKWVEWSGGALTLAAVIGVFFFRHLPVNGEARPAGFTIYVAIVVAQWVFLMGVVSIQLWRGGRDQPRISRNRMRTLSLAAFGMGLAIALSGATPTRANPGVAEVVTSLIVLAVGPLFLLGFAPPQIVLAAWRRADESELRQATSGLIAASTESEIGETLLPHVARIMGAQSATMTDSRGDVIAVFGQQEATPSPQRVTIPLERGWLSVQANPYTPYFGREAQELMAALADYTDIALRRARLAEGERRLADDLRQANETMRDFVAVASHDLRTPVAIIKGFSNTMVGQWDRLTDDDKLDYLGTIGRQSDHLSRLVDDLLTMSRLDADAVRPDVRSVRVDEVVRETLRDLGIESKVEASVPEHLCVSADREHLLRIIRNYVENAFKYGLPPVRVTAQEAGRNVEIRVIDHGPGVPHDFRDRLFQRFSRAGRGRGSRDTGSTGLGLSIVKGLATAGGGEAWFESVEPTGACFAVRLPKTTSSGVR
jgi:signal transduction histidine kinase